MALCGQGYRQLFLIFASSGSPFFHFIPVVYSPGNRLFSFSGTWLVRPVYPIVLLRDIVFVLVLPLLLLLQAYQICGVFGQQPIHFEHAHLYAIPKCVRLNQRHDSGDEDGIQEIMTATGRIRCFGNTKENWVTYVKRLERFFLANDIDDDHKVPTLLNLIGGKTYTLLRDLLAPGKPATKSFQQIVTAVQEHLSLTPLEIAERFHFYKRNQHEGESSLSYMAKLRKLVTYCNFGGNLNEAVRDRLVCGLRNMQIQKRLLSEAKLRYSKAVEIAVAMETAIRDASELQSELNSNPVSHIAKLTEHNKPTPAKPATTTPLLPLWWEHIYDTVVITRTRFATTMENRAIFSEFVVPNSEASLIKQPTPQRYMLLRLMLMLMKTS